MRSFLIISLIISPWICAPVFAINERFTLEKDLSYDGIPDQIVYEVATPDWEQPVSWSFTVTIDGRLAFRHSVENETNPFFGAPGYMDNCSGFTQCKKDWYLKRAFDSMLQSIDSTHGNKDSILKTFQLFGPQYYATTLSLSEEEANKSTLELMQFLKDNNIECIIMPTSPVHSEGLLTYDKFQKKFVLLYQP